MPLETQSSADPEPRCPRCGSPLPAHGAICRRCRAAAAATPRDRILLVSFILLILLFALTGFTARMYHAKERAIAETWLNRGIQAADSGRVEEAIADFHDALYYDPDNPTSQLRLAETLASAGRLEEAQAYLLHLLELAPGSGEVNLELAHLAEKRGDTGAAAEYFHSAINGVWQSDAPALRIATRIELCRMLIGQSKFRQAQAEIAALSAVLSPEDSTGHFQVAQLYLQAGNLAGALAEFDTVLRANPKNAAAQAGAGSAAFALGDYNRAQRFLARAVRLNASDTQSAALLHTASDVEDLDPFLTGISDQEKQDRVVRAFGMAWERLNQCAQRSKQTLESLPPQTSLQRLYTEGKALKPQMNARGIRRHADLVLPAMDWVFRVETETSKTCGEPAGADEALLLLARQRAGAQR